MILFFKAKQDNYLSEQTILDMSFPGEVNFGEISGQEKVIIYESKKHFEEGVFQLRDAQHILMVKNSRQVSSDEVLELAKQGVSYLVEKGDVSELVTKVSQAYSQGQSQTKPILKEIEIPTFKTVLDVDHRYQAEGFVNSYVIGKSEQIKKAITDLSTSAYFDNDDLLILGENGVGKELFMKVAMENSPRKKSVVINVGAESEELFRSNIMGYKKGAFTGADRDRDGYLKQYDGGIIALDEIGDLSMSNQSILLRALQERQATPLGPGAMPYKFDIKFIFATNKPIEKMVEEGKFRLDLFNRLKKQMITIPPLRDRREDIAILASGFVEKLNQKYPDRAKGITLEAIGLLQKLDWPGNVRELENTVFRIFAQEKTSCIELQTVFQVIKSEEYRPERAPTPNFAKIEEIAKRHNLKLVNTGFEQPVDIGNEMGVNMSRLMK